MHPALRKEKFNFFLKKKQPPHPSSWDLKLFHRTEALYQRISRFQILQMLQTIQTKGTVSPEERFSVLD